MNLPQRKNLRLRNYDYSQNAAYFITICSKHRQPIFSTIVGAIHESPAVDFHLSQYGEIADSHIQTLPNRFPNCTIGHYVIMPNHVHLIIHIIDNPQRAIRESPLHRDKRHRSELSKILGYLKMNVSKQIHKTNPSLEVWHRGYHDHIIRTQEEYSQIWYYIDQNPLTWKTDCFFNADEYIVYEI